MSRMADARPRAGMAIVLLLGLSLASSCSAGRADSLSAAQLVSPDSLAAELRAPGREQPLLVHVGFQSLYRAGAIPGSRYAGPGSRPEGIAALAAAVRDVPRDRPIVLYCGCCPWEHCPNVAPAYRKLHALGFKNARVLHVTRNFQSDWADRGFPVDDRPR